MRRVVVYEEKEWVEEGRVTKLQSMCDPRKNICHSSSSTSRTSTGSYIFPESRTNEVSVSRAVNGGKTRTLISLSNALLMRERWIFCAAVTSPFSGVHSVGVKITACRISIGLKPFFLPRALQSFSTKSLTFWLWHRSSSGSDASTPDTHESQI